jgi:ADP-heptose:LPS heptosyltransferase
LGWGDEIIAAGQAKKAQLTDPRKVQIIGADGAQRWHAIWENNPRIATLGEQGNFQKIKNGGNARPYIVSKTPEKWTWKAFKPTPGEIYFNQHEIKFAKQFKPQIIIQPFLKQRASPNKQWHHWFEFVKMAHLAGYELTQLAPIGTPNFYNVNMIFTQDFRTACAVLANSVAYVGHEGGLHHAAAALNIPAVVLFGGFISPENTGYDMHRNIFTGGKACGMRIECQHCAKAMDAITPEMVLNHLRELLNG